MKKTLALCSLAALALTGCSAEDTVTTAATTHVTTPTTTALPTTVTPTPTVTVTQTKTVTRKWTPEPTHTDWVTETVTAKPTPRATTAPPLPTQPPQTVTPVPTSTIAAPVSTPPSVPQVAGTIAAKSVALDAAGLPVSYVVKVLTDAIPQTPKTGPWCEIARANYDVVKVGQVVDPTLVRGCVSAQTKAASMGLMPRLEQYEVVKKVAPNQIGLDTMNGEDLTCSVSPALFNAVKEGSVVDAAAVKKCLPFE